MKVRFCDHNKGATKAYKRLKAERPKLDVKMKDCIKKCGPCHKTPFATVDGKTVCTDERKLRFLAPTQPDERVIDFEITIKASDGDVTFAWSGEADAVFLVGTPTSWRRVPLARSGRKFTLRLVVPPGRHEYRFEVEVGGAVRTVLPEGAERVDDGYGGENAVLRVGGT